MRENLISQDVKDSTIDMIVSSEQAPARASIVRFDNAKEQFSFDGAGEKVNAFSLSAETDDSKVDKREVDVDHSDGAYLSNNLSGLSTRTWEERESADHDEGWADDSAWDGKNGREPPPLAPVASDALEKLREMRQLLEADPTLRETLSKSESMTNSESKPFTRTSSNALDALRSVRMQLEANKDVAKAVSETLNPTPRVGLPPRSPDKAKRAGRFFKKSSHNDAQEPDGVEKGKGDDRSIASLVGVPPPPPPPVPMKTSTGSVADGGAAVCDPGESLVPLPDGTLQSPSHEEESNPKSNDDVNEENMEDVGKVGPSLLPPPPSKGKLSMRRFFKKSVPKGTPDAPLLPPDASPSEGVDQEPEDPEDEGDVQDPSVEVVLKRYVAPEGDEPNLPKKPARCKEHFQKKLGRKNKKEIPELSPANVEGGSASGQFDEGPNFPRVFSSDSFEGSLNMNTHRVDEVEDEDDDSTGVAPSNGFRYATDDNKLMIGEIHSRKLFDSDTAAPAPLPDTADDPFTFAVDFDSHRFTEIDVKDIERKMKQKRASDASVSSSRGPASLAGTAGKKVGQLSSTASVKSGRTSKSVKGSKNRPSSHSTKPKKPAIYHNGKLAGNAGTTQKGDHGKSRDDNKSFTRWPQK